MIHGVSWNTVYSCSEKMSRNLSRPVNMHLGALPSYLMDHHNVTLVFYFFISTSFFHYLLSGRGVELGDHSVFMPSLSMYELTNQD